MIQKRRNALIIGSGRSGTTWLLSMISTHKKICSAGVGELLLFEDYLLPSLAAWERKKALQAQGIYANSPLLFSKEELIGYLHNFVDQIYEKVVDKNPACELIIEKAPASSHNVAKIREFYDDMIFIHIIRDGRDVVNSRLRASQSWAKNWGASVKGATQKWVSSVSAAKEANLNIGKYYEVKYEDLLKDGVNCLKEIFDWLGLTVQLDEVEEIYSANSFEQMKKRYGKTFKEGENLGANNFAVPPSFFYRGKADSWKTDLDNFQMYQIHILASPLLQELGYIKDSGWWYKNNWQKIFFPLLYRFKSLG